MRIALLPGHSKSLQRSGLKVLGDGEARSLGHDALEGGKVVLLVLR